MVQLTKVTCKFCKKEFKTPEKGRDTAVYCSKTCFGGIKMECQRCGKPKSAKWIIYNCRTPIYAGKVGGFLAVCNECVGKDKDDKTLPSWLLVEFMGEEKRPRDEGWY